MIRRMGAALVAASILASAAVGTAAAAKPLAGCPIGFERGPMTLEQSLAIKIALGLPAEAVPFYEALFGGFDKNDNGLLCLKDLPDTPGIAAWVFQLADDVASSGSH